MSIKPTSEKAAEYWFFGQQCLNLQSSGTRALVDGIHTIICKYTPDEAILIDVSDAHFAFNNKAKGNFSTLTYDDQEGTWEADYDSLGASYGNVDWKGFDDEVLCWKGVASRHFSVDTEVGIPGYMEFDEELGDLFPVTYYTPFGPNVYYQGDVLKTFTMAGAKVLGCAFNEGKLIAIVGTNYRDVTNPDGGTGGFFNEIWLENVRIGYQRASRPKENWFFNQSGTEAQAVIGRQIRKLVVTKTVLPDGTSEYTVAFSVRDACTGSTTETKTNTSTPIDTMGNRPPPGLGAFNPAEYTAGDGARDGTKTETVIEVSEVQTCVVAVDYVDDAEVTAVAVYGLQDKSVYKTEAYTEYGWDEECPQYPPDPLSEISGPDAWTQAIDFGVSGGCAPYEWTFPADTDCGAVTISVTDATGASKSKTVRGMVGEWSAGSTGNDFCKVTGTTRICYGMFQAGCGTIVSGTCGGIGTELRDCGATPEGSVSIDPTAIVDGDGTWFATSLPSSRTTSYAYCWPIYCPGPGTACTYEYVIGYDGTHFSSSWVCP